MSDTTITDYRALAEQIRQWGTEFGFQQVGIADTDLTLAEQHLHHWLDQGMHGDMAYMARHGLKRSRPEELMPGTLRIISVRMDYLPPDDQPEHVLANTERGFISRYALGRDYHKLMRNRLQKMAQKIGDVVGPFGYRAFVDSAPVLERALAEKAGLGWTGKHSNIVNRRAGSWFFLGELYTTLPLPIDQTESDHCGRCTDCIDICPTQAIVAPYQVDARRCISYLTIELDGPIPESLRPLMGNRIFGCDDCLMACPWNRFATPAQGEEFLPRHGLDNPTLCSLFAWDEETFLKRLEGSPIRRMGHERWLRNIAIALGNAVTTPAVIEALKRRRADGSTLVREHIAWALQQHGE